MIDPTRQETEIAEREVVETEVNPAWYQRVSWGAILAGVVIALLTQFAMEMLGIALGVGAFEAGEDTLGPSFTTAVVVWLAASALVALFVGGLVTGKLARTIDPVAAILQGLVAMGVVTFISFFLMTSGVTSAIRGVTNFISDGLSFVGAQVEDVSTTVADAATLRDDTLAGIRAEAEELLADDASLTSLRLTLDDYLLSDEPGNDTRQAAIDALATQTELTQEEAAQRIDAWESELTQAVQNFEERAEVVANDIADIIAITAGVIFMVLILGAFAAGAGAYVAVASRPEAKNNIVHTFRRRQIAADLRS